MYAIETNAESLQSIEGYVPLSAQVFLSQSDLLPLSREWELVDASVFLVNS
jgi:hypothetical protein